MTCHDVTAIVGVQSKGSLLSPDVSEHIAGCEPCRKLLQSFGGVSEDDPLLSERLKLIRNSVLDDLQPVRPLPSSIMLFAGFLIAFAVVAFIVPINSRARGWDALNLLQKLTIFITLVGGASLLSTSIAKQMQPGSRFIVSPAALPASLLLTLFIVMAASFQPQYELQFVSHGLICLLAGIRYAALGGVVTRLILRRGANLSPIPLGATTGALAGLMGVTMLEVHCPDLNLYHILAWHLGVLMLSILGGVTLGGAAEWTAQRRYSPAR